MPSNPEPTEGTFKETAENLNVRENVQGSLTAPEPTQPLTDERLARIKARSDAFRKSSMGNGMNAAYDSAADVPRLLAEVSRLRAENTAMAAKLDVIVSFVNEPTTPERAAGMLTARRLVNDLMGIKAQANQWEQMTHPALDQSGEGQANADR